MAETRQCIVDQVTYPITEGVVLQQLDTSTRNLIKTDFPKAKVTNFICNHHLLKYQLLRVNSLIAADIKQSQKINKRLTKALENDDYDIIDVNEHLNRSLTFGQRVSDAVAHFGGSWGFIGIFVFVLVGWMLVNGLGLFGVHFDKYPFILLNLVLSCVAAVQAPIIMMSQNRAADRDRMDSENDYHVNLKSEHELRILHAKLDNLTQRQIPHTMEIQKIQIEILSQIRTEINDLQTKSKE